MVFLCSYDVTFLNCSRANQWFYLNFQSKAKFPSRKVRERFFLVYELEGCQKAVDFLTEYYRIKRMKVVLNGRKVGNGDTAVCFQNRAYFTKRGLNKRTILHELYHHLVYVNDLNMPQRMEEKSANKYALDFLS
jgi:hypothetical protein